MNCNWYSKRKFEFFQESVPKNNSCYGALNKKTCDTRNSNFWKIELKILSFYFWQITNFFSGFQNAFDGQGCKTVIPKEVFLLLVLKTFFVNTKMDVHCYWDISKCKHFVKFKLLWPWRHCNCKNRVFFKK